MSTEGVDKKTKIFLFYKKKTLQKVLQFKTKIWMNLKRDVSLQQRQSKNTV